MRPDHSGYGGGIDNRPTTLPGHLLDFRFHAQPDPFQIDGQYLVKHGFVKVGGPRQRTFNPGVVKSTIQPAKADYRLVNQVLHLPGLGDIGLDKKRTAAALVNLLHRFFARRNRHIGHNHVRPRLSQGQGSHAADAPTSACHQSNFVLKLK
jgi:hypothetical protein